MGRVTKTMILIRSVRPNNFKKGGSQVKHKKTWSKYIVLLLAVIALSATVITTVTVAKYLKKADELKNNFSPAAPEDPKIEEKFENNVKEDVYFEVSENPTEYPVYFRVKIIVSWKRIEDGNEIIYFKPPVEGVDKDYTMTLINLDKDHWVKEGEYYYFTQPVESGGRTATLIEKCIQSEKASVPEGYFLSVDIIVQTIQAVGSTDIEYDENGNVIKGEIPAYQDAWKDSPGLTPAVPPTNEPSIVETPTEEPTPEP